jgi:rhamnogalacturonyl hydrolase YesR
MLNYMDRAGRPKLLAACRQVVDLYLGHASRYRDVISNYTRADEQGLLRSEIAFQFCPALARLTRYSGEPRYADIAVDQLRRLEKELRDGETGLWYLGVGRGGRTPCLWARGCSFSFRGVVDTLAELDAAHPGQEDLLGILHRLADALRRHQNEHGEWHQVMNEPTTRPEGSSTAWCVAGFAKAIRYGWLDASYEEPVQRGWRAVKRRTWQGYSTRVCGGVTGSMDPEYYRFRHFMSPSYGHFNLLAAIEILRRDH